MSYFKRRAFFTRIALLTGIIGLLVTAFALLHAGASAQLRAAQALAEINDEGRILMTAALQIKQACQAAMEGPERVDRDALKASLDTWAAGVAESGEALAAASEAFDIPEEAADLRLNLRQLAGSLDQFSAGNSAERETLARIVESASTLYSLADNTQEEAEGVAVGMNANGGRRAHLAWGCFLLALAVGLVAGIMLILDILNEAMGPLDLDAALKFVEGERDFQTRLRKIAPQTAAPPEEGNWSLRLVRRLNEQRTHTTFEAEAERGPEKVRLWGKCYRWAGILKGAQRLIWRGYARGTWQAINVLHNRGLNTPFPIVLEPIRRSGFTVGYVLLTEYVEGMVNVVKFMRANFPMMTPEERRQFLTGVLRFWNRLHDSGVHSMTFKCLYVRNARPDHTADAEFHLLDLDKTSVSRRPGSLGCRISIWHDNRHMRKALWEYLTQEEMEFAEVMLRRKIDG